jgi:RNA polymerase sigma-70 factor (ECF subfamily)
MDQLLRRHHDRVFAVCRRITGNDADAADASQEALISIVRSLGKFDGRSSFGTWVYRIATNASLDELRRRRRRPTVGATESIGHDLAHDIADPDAGVRIEIVAERMAIDVALAGLAEDFRIPIVLRDLAGLDYGEIAEVIGIPIGTVKSRIARGRANLSQLLTAGNQPGDDERPTPAP